MAPEAPPVWPVHNLVAPDVAPAPTAPAAPAPASSPSPTPVPTSPEAPGGGVQAALGARPLTLRFSDPAPVAVALVCGDAEVGQRVPLQDGTATLPAWMPGCRVAAHRGDDAPPVLLTIPGADGPLACRLDEAACAP